MEISCQIILTKYADKEENCKCAALILDANDINLAEKIEDFIKIFKSLNHIP